MDREININASRQHIAAGPVMGVRDIYFLYLQAIFHLPNCKDSMIDRNN